MTVMTDDFDELQSLLGTDPKNEKRRKFEAMMTRTGWKQIKPGLWQREFHGD